MMADPHFNARGMFEQVQVNGKPLKIPAIPPILGETPGRTDTPGPALGAHTDAVLEQLLGRKADERAALRAAGALSEREPAPPGRAAPCRRVNGNRGRGDDPVRQALPSRSVFLVVLAARILGFHLAARRGLVRLGVREGWDGRQGRAKRHHHQQRSGGGQQTLEGSFHCSLLAGRHAPVARDMRASCQPANALPVQALGANCRATETPPGVGAAQQIAVARPSRATSPSRRAALPAAEASSAAAPRVRRFVDVAVERLRAECF
jgi:hypothetical protein